MLFADTVGAEHRPSAQQALRECVQRSPGDGWSLIWSCCLGLGEGGAAGLLSTLGKPGPQSARFQGEGNLEGLRCLKTPASGLAVHVDLRPTPRLGNADEDTATSRREREGRTALEQSHS